MTRDADFYIHPLSLIKTSGDTYNKSMNIKFTTTAGAIMHNYNSAHPRFTKMFPAREKGEDF